MKINVNVKKAGSRRAALTKAEYDIPFEEGTLMDILAFFVSREVEKYNGRSLSDAIIYLTEKEIEAEASQGKVGFGYAATERKADLKTAVDNALMCYKDGLVRVFLNDNELTDPDETVKISEGDTFTFIRLTFLAGRTW